MSEQSAAQQQETSYFKNLIKCFDMSKNTCIQECFMSITQKIPVSKNASWVSLNGKGNLHVHFQCYYSYYSSLHNAHKNEMLRIPQCLDNQLTVNREILATCSSTYSPVCTSQEAHSSAKDNLGYFELKKHMPWFDEGRSKLLDQKLNCSGYGIQVK
jgi:hypothetical protein